MTTCTTTDLQVLWTYFGDRTYPGSVMNEMLVWMDDTGGTGADAATRILVISRRCMEGMG